VAKLVTMFFLPGSSDETGRAASLPLPERKVRASNRAKKGWL